MRDIIKIHGLLLLVSLFMLTVRVSGQEGKFPEIGKQVPFFTFPVNSGDTLTLDDFKGKHFILDFWNMGCLACIEAFPKMDSLQSKYKDRLKVILVGNEDKRNNVGNFYEIYKKKFNLKVLSIYDSITFKKFVPRGVPHLIWVDELGIVRAITTTNDINEENLDRFINGQDFAYIDVSYKSLASAKAGFDKSKPLLIGGNGGEDTSYVFRSIISIWQHDKATPNFMPVYPTIYGSKARYEVIGASLSLLYTLAFYGTVSVKSEIPDAYPFPKINDDAMKVLIERGIEKQRYNYSLELPERIATRSTMMKKMQNDLSSYFGITAKLSKKPVECYRLVIIDQSKVRALKRTSKQKIISWRADNKVQKFVDVPLDDILTTITSRVLYPQFILAYNETGLTDRLTFNLEVDINDLASIRKGLQKIGMDLLPSTRSMRVIEIDVPRNENTQVN